MRILLLLTALASTLSAGLIADTGVFSYRAPIGQFTSYGGTDFHIAGLMEIGSGTIFSGLLTSTSPTANVPVNFGSTLRVGTLTYQGNSYTDINPISTENVVSLSILGAPVTINGGGTFLGTFTANGIIRYDNIPGPSPPWNIANETYTGHGWVEVKVVAGAPFPILGDIPFGVESITYHFAPEPWSAGLVACPLAWLAYRRRRLL